MDPTTRSCAAVALRLCCCWVLPGAVWHHRDPQGERHPLRQEVNSGRSTRSEGGGAVAGPCPAVSSSRGGRAAAVSSPTCTTAAAAPLECHRTANEEYLHQPQHTPGLQPCSNRHLSGGCGLCSLSRHIALSPAASHVPAGIIAAASLIIGPRSWGMPCPTVVHMSGPSLVPPYIVLPAAWIVSPLCRGSASCQQRQQGACRTLLLVGRPWLCANSQGSHATPPAAAAPHSRHYSSTISTARMSSNSR
jgi:hypothetical protein